MTANRKVYSVAVPALMPVWIGDSTELVNSKAESTPLTIYMDARRSPVEIMVAEIVAAARADGDRHRSRSAQWPSHRFRNRTGFRWRRCRRRWRRSGSQRPCHSTRLRERTTRSMCPIAPEVMPTTYSPATNSTVPLLNSSTEPKVTCDQPPAVALNMPEVAST